MKDSEILFRHTKPDKRGRRKTFSGIIVNGHIQIGVSQCSENDQFCKATGRSISSNRAISEPIVTLPLHTTERFRETFHVACSTVINLSK